MWSIIQAKTRCTLFIYQCPETGGDELEHRKQEICAGVQKIGRVGSRRSVLIRRLGSYTCQFSLRKIWKILIWPNKTKQSGPGFDFRSEPFCLKCMFSPCSCGFPPGFLPPSKEAKVNCECLKDTHLGLGQLWKKVHVMFIFLCQPCDELTPPAFTHCHLG